jgi:pullulanase/glycogen debranching enzyme
MESTKTEVWPGQAYPLGATYDGIGTNLTLFSEEAERVELCLFDDSGGNEQRLDFDTAIVPVPSEPQPTGTKAVAAARDVQIFRRV